MKSYTIFGGTGFIGSHFVKFLKKMGHSVWIPEKNDSSIFNKKLGIVIYAAGYGNCTDNPYNVLQANTSLLSHILDKGQFDKLIYLSSTRIYMNQSISTEDSSVLINFEDNRKLFNLTKLISEELCIKSNRDCMIIRPSNVYGLSLNSPLFLPSIIRDAVKNKVVNMYVSPNYRKDYISVDDLVNATIKLSELNTPPKIINVASGKNISAEEIAKILKEKTDCNILWNKPLSNYEVFPPINIDKLRRKIQFNPRNVLSDLDKMILEYKDIIKNEKS